MSLLRRFTQSQSNESEEAIALSVRPKLDGSLDSQGRLYGSVPHEDHVGYGVNPVSGDALASALNNPSPTRRQFTGWKVGATSAAVVGLATLVVNLAALGWLQRHPNVDSGLVEVYHGDCRQVERLQIWSHFAINALSTLLLSGSNYCMQVLCAPTRSELDRVHARRRYMDVGVQSVRNLRYVSPYRAVVWWTLGLSSIPLHLMYNSAFYSSIGVADYRTSIVTPGFEDGAPFRVQGDIFNPSAGDPCTGNSTCHSAVEAMLSNVQADPDRFSRLDREACLVAYSNTLLTQRSNLILVTSGTDAGDNNSDNSLLDDYYYAFNESIDLKRTRYEPFDWICYSSSRMRKEFREAADRYQVGAGPCDAWVDKIITNADKWTPYDYDVDHCLSERIEERCAFNGNTAILAVVIAFNALKIACMLWVAFGLDRHTFSAADSDLPLITVGDAIASYLRRPDPITEGYCMWGQRDFKDAVAELRDKQRVQTATGFVHSKSSRSDPSPRVTPAQILAAAAKTPTLTPTRWSSGASKARWGWTAAFLLAALITVLSLFGAGYSQISEHKTALSALGFGKINASALVNGWGLLYIRSKRRQIAAAVIVANLPQAILSFLYLHLNGLATSLALTGEALRFATPGEGAPLRVSLPVGETRQRGTWFLQLPYHSAVPLMALSGVLHWLVSQSFFLAVVAQYDWEGGLVNATAIATCGYSLVPMLVVVGLGLGILVAMWVVGRCGKWDGRGMPVLGSCSLAISAACHRPEGMEGLEFGVVRWGVVCDRGGNGDIGHCSFAGGEVGEVSDGKKYG